MYKVEYDKFLVYCKPRVCDECVIRYPKCCASINKPVACHAHIYV